MSDVFISYSRKDIAFARILHNAIRSRGLDTWIDWQDIPPSADWLAEVYEAIEASDAFVFIVSRTSIQSEICSKEIAHAAKNHKRLIPIVTQEVDPASLPSEVTGLNWIFFREGQDDYQASFDALLKAIQTDWVWVKAHTRLQMRALEWDTNKRNRSYLLRGKDLTDTEAAVFRTEPARDPEPTALQREFVLASRTETNRKRKQILGISAAAAVVLILISLYGLVQYSAAAGQTRIARSRQLAGQALSFQGSDERLAALLAIEAYQTADTSEARNSLLTALQSGPAPTVFPPVQAGEILSLTYSPDGRILASSGEEGSLILWNVAVPESPAAIGSPLRGHSAAVRTLAFHPKEGILVSAGDDRTILFWDLGDPASPRKISQLSNVHAESVTTVAFNPRGDLLVSGGRDGVLLLWDVSDPGSPVQIAAIQTPQTDVSAVRFSPNGRKMAIASSDTSIWLYDVTDAHNPKVIGIPFLYHTGPVCCLEFSPNGAVFVTGSSDKTLVVWDAESTFSSTVDPLDNLLFGNFDDPAAPNKIESLQGHDSSIRSLAYHPSGNTLASGDESPAVIVWDVSDPSSPSRIGAPLSGAKGPVLSLAFSPDGNTLTAGDSAGTIVSWTFTDTGSPLLAGPALIRGKGSIRDFYFGRGEQTLFSLHSDQTVSEWDLTIPAAPVLRGIWNLSDPDLPVSIDPSAVEPQAASAVDPDRRIKASGGCSQSSTTHYDCVRGEIVLWDISNLASPKQVGSPLADHSGSVTSLAFSPDGKLLASGSGDTTIILWDVSNPAAPRKLGTGLTGHRGGLSSLAFQPGGDLLFSGDDNGTILFWKIRPSSWMDLLCRRVEGNFSAEEWKQFLPSEPYRSTCPAKQ